jgi:hypothetical protein
MNPSRPPLPPNKPYCWPFNYLEYVKNFNLDALVRILKTAIKANRETKGVNIVNMFSFTLRDIMSNWCNNYMGDYLGMNFCRITISFL